MKGSLFSGPTRPLGVNALEIPGDGSSSSLEPLILQLQMPSHREVQAAVTYLHRKSHLTAHFTIETHIHGEEAFLPQSWHVEGMEVEFHTSSQAAKFRTRATVKGECERRACEDWPEGSGGITEPLPS